MPGEHLENRTGQLFDLASDGLGFIADSADDRIWAFNYEKFGAALAPDLKTFLSLEGKDVDFAVSEAKIQSIKPNPSNSRELKVTKAFTASY